MQHILGQVRRCVEDYHMIDAGDTVAVGVSGGKDSLLTLTALIALGGGALVAAALLVLWRYHHVAVKEFGGITGDLAGWFLQKAEFWMLAALAASQWGGIL